MNYANLKQLPSTHQLRTSPLADINAECRNNAAPTEEWRRIEGHFPHAGKCYNELPLSWIAYCDWRAPV